MHPTLRSIAILAALTTIFTVVERRWGTQRLSLRHVLFNASWGILAYVVYPWVEGPTRPLWEFLRAHAVLQNEINALAAAYPWAAALLSLFVYDVLQYWMHRAQHRFPLLWKTHHLHHADTSVCGSTSARTHPTSHLLGIIMVNAPLFILFPVSPLTFWWGLVFFHLYGFFNHTSVPLSLGPLTPVLSGPEFHRIHHSMDPKDYDKNFAAFFPILDVVFGTYRAPRTARSVPVRSPRHSLEVRA